MWALPILWEHGECGTCVCVVLRRLSGGIGSGPRRMGWCYVCVHCEFGLFVYLHPVFNHVAPYRDLLPTMHLFVADIENTYLFLCDCRTWIALDIIRFYE